MGIVYYLKGKSLNEINKEIDCESCKYFMTYPIINPSGKCYYDSSNIQGCGAGYTCENFVKRGSPKTGMRLNEIDFDSIEQGVTISVKNEDIVKIFEELEKRGWKIK